MSEHTVTTYELHEDAVTFADVPVGSEFADDCGHICHKSTRDSAFVYPLLDYLYFGNHESVKRIKKKVVTTTFE